MSSFLYLRGLKQADLTVFGVDNGQKTYYDYRANYPLPYSSGQQVKRSIMEAFIDCLGIQPAPITFISVVTVKKDKKSLGEGAPLGLCDPSYPDQLIGGYMNVDSKESEGTEKRTIKRRSPLSISAMRPLHPDLAGVKTENVSFDRSDRPEVHKPIVRDEKGRRLSEEEIVELLGGQNRSLFRKWIQGESRAVGLFIYDVAIDLRRLFTVSINQFEPEISPDTIEALKSKGWSEGQNVFGKCLMAPKSEREKITKALAYALLNWRITSNQSRTYSPMETLAVGISDNASLIAGSIRVTLPLDDNAKVEPIADDTVEGVSLFVHTAGALHNVRSNIASPYALKQAEDELIKRITAYADAL
ncbi:hypothetical protein GCM10028806_09620 [Spirosoma terrae]|uniref:CRISPR-associated protein Cas7 n=1 Tax=Spirosoma terrae TaxID=1968276 RepID=A0A6L9L5P5_9BACT|nr:CRISPR-associated protein Cas7 [Spirosoma terrae]NDU95896.1 CRISPR-associated protein Cas7 [Spirosoma terrae]